MFSTNLVDGSRMRLSPLAGLLLFFWPMTSTAATFGSLDESTQVAQVLAVIKGKSVVAEASAPQVIITRATGNCAEAGVVVRKGLPLCTGDRLKTAPNWTLKIAFGDPQDRNEFTLSPDSEVTIASFDCGGVCRWFASLSNRFTNRVPHVALTNKSTTYEVIVEEDSSSKLIVYEGEVEVARTDAPPAPSPSDSAAAGSERSVAAPDTVQRLFKATIHADGTMDKVAMTKEDLRGDLAFSSEAEIDLHRKPAEAGGNVAKFVNFRDDADRKTKFITARCDSFWQPDQPQAFVTLGKVYNDWGNGLKAVEFFAKAAALAGYEPTDDVLINRAIAFRQIGQHTQALEQVDAVLSKRDPNLWGAAFNVRGSIFYDQARLALRADQTETSIAQAQQLLEKAKMDFEAAEANSETQQQYTQVNLGQVLKTQGDIAEREGRYADAKQLYTSAIKALMASYGRTENRQNKVAGLLVARARAALANTYAALGNTEEALSFYNLAEATYMQSIKDAEKDQQNFADAYCGLASLYQILGNDSNAQVNYAKCVAFNVAALVTDVEVPNIVGRTRAAAIRALAEAGLEAEFETGNDGEVVETQEPAAGQTVKTGRKIKLHLKFLARS